MKISIARPPRFAYFETVSIKSLEQMAELCIENNFSPAIFKNGKRNLASFETAYCIGLDIDNDDNKVVHGRPVPQMTLEEAKEAFKDYTHLILTSRSHQKEKNGQVKDRFRVILFFSEPIADLDTFYETWHWCKAQWPAIDDQCKDPSRGFFAHSGLASLRGKGTRITPVQPKPKEPSKGLIKLEALSAEARGKLARATLEFLLNGAEQGNRNGSTYKAAKDFQQNLFSLEEAEARIVEALQRTDTLASDFTEDEALTTIRSAFNTEPKHDPRIKPPAFNLVPIGELYEQTAGAEVEWLVDGLLQVAGVSLLAADPKAGKSVIARQLCASILTGQPFFTRTARKGACHYYGLEEHPTIVAKSFHNLGVAPDAPLFVHCGDPLVDEDVFAEFSKVIMEQKPALAIIDTAFDLIEVESENNYRDVKRALKSVRTVARNSGTHILLIHHAGKPQKDHKQRGNHAVLGSTAIVGGVDAIMVIQLFGATRVIYTSGREVEPWNGRVLEWSGRTRTYSLGRPYDEF